MKSASLPIVSLATEGAEGGAPFTVESWNIMES